jgi:hypothetical protein
MKWLSSTPKEVGWYIASTHRNPHIMRYWNGVRWSSSCDIRHQDESKRDTAGLRVLIGYEKVEYLEPPLVLDDETRRPVVATDDEQGPLITNYIDFGLGMIAGLLTVIVMILIMK